MSLSSLFSFVGKLLALRVWEWVIISVVLFGLYCFWCLWLGSRAEAEFKKLDADARADASKFSVWFRSILVRLHFAKAK